MMVAIWTISERQETLWRRYSRGREHNLHRFWKGEDYTVSGAKDNNQGYFEIGPEAGFGSDLG